MKKLLATILALTLAATAAGCSQSPGDASAAVMTEISLDGMPDYSKDIDTKVFTIGQWVNVPQPVFLARLRYGKGRIRRHAYG